MKMNLAASTTTRDEILRGEWEMQDDPERLPTVQLDVDTPANPVLYRCPPILIL
jgi:hypothetical protein